MNVQANAYSRARTLFGFRIKRVWFKLNPSLERSHTTEDKPEVYYQPNSKFVLPRQSIVLCEDTDDANVMPTHKEMPIASFWHYLYSNSWGEKCSLRILDGELLDTMLTALFVLERDDVICVRSTRAMTTNNRRKAAYYRKSDFEKAEVIQETLYINFTYYGRHDDDCDDGSSYPDSDDTSSCCSICDFGSTASDRSVKDVSKPRMLCPHGYRRKGSSTPQSTLRKKTMKTAGNRFHLEMLAREKRSHEQPQVSDSTEDTAKPEEVLDLDKLPCSQRTSDRLQTSLEFERHQQYGQYFLRLDSIDETKLPVKERLQLGRNMKAIEREEKRKQLQRRRDHSLQPPQAHITGEDIRAVGLVTRRFKQNPSFRAFIKWSGKLNSNRQKATRLVRQFKYKLGSATDVSQSTSVDVPSKTSSHQFTKRFAEEVGGVTDSVAMRNAILHFQLMKAAATSGTHLPAKGIRRFVLHDEFVEVPDTEAKVRRKVLDKGQTSGGAHLPEKGGPSEKSLHHEEADGATAGVSGSNTSLISNGKEHAEKTQTAAWPSLHLPAILGLTSPRPWVFTRGNKVAPTSTSDASSIELPVYESLHQPSRMGRGVETLRFRNLNRKYSWERLRGRKRSNRPQFVEALKKFYRYKKKRRRSDPKDPPRQPTFQEVVQQINNKPVEMVLGKLKPYRFQENSNYKTSIHDMDLVDFKGIDSKEFVANLIRAMGYFVVRKEDVTTSYGMETLTTVTFTRRIVFRPIIH